MELLFHGPVTLALIVACLGCVQAAYVYLRRRPRRSGLFILRCVLFVCMAIVVSQPTSLVREQATAGAVVDFVLDTTESMRGRLDEGSWRPILEELLTTNSVTVHLGGAEGIQASTRIRPTDANIDEQISLLASRVAKLMADDRESEKGEPKAAEFAGAVLSPIADWVIQSCQESQQPGCIFLVSDGQANAGASVDEAVRSLEATGSPLFAVVDSQAEEQSELAITRFDVPNHHFVASDIVGEIRFRDNGETGQAIDIAITSNDTVLWSKRVYSDSSGERLLSFAFPAAMALNALAATAEAAEQSPRASSSRQSEVVELECRLQVSPNLAGEQASALTARTVISDHGTRVLIVDSQPRWETRYLRNLFDRDPAWQSQCIIAGDDSYVPSDGEAGDRREESEFAEVDFSDVDLVIWGDAPVQLLSQSQQLELANEVSNGLGLIFIDGTQRHCHEPGVLSDLLPVVPQPRSDLPQADNQSREPLISPRGYSVETPTGNFEPLQISDLHDWANLPKLSPFDAMKPNFSAEAVLFAKDLGRRIPLLVKSQAGDGKLLYWATDQTWRWRYRHADRLHGRLWIQLSRWCARQPPNVSDELVAIYVEPLQSISPGKDASESFEIGCHFRTPQTPTDAVAEVLSEGDVVATVPLVPVLGSKISADQDRSLLGEPAVPRFVGSAAGLPPGEYRVRIRASGFGEGVGRLARIVVTRRQSTELIHRGIDRQFLNKLTDASEGRWISGASDMIEALGTKRGGRVAVVERAIWQSWWLFATMIALFGAELFLRRRLGMP